MVVTLWGKKFWSAHTILVHIHIFIACVFELPRSMLKNLFKYPASVWREIGGQTSTFFYSHFTSNATHPQHPCSMLVQPMNLNVLKVFKCWKSRVKHLLGGLFKFHFYICWCRSGGFCCYSCHSLGFIDNHNRLLLIYTCNIMHCTLGTCVSQLSHFYDFAISRKKCKLFYIISTFAAYSHFHFHFFALFFYSFKNYYYIIQNFSHSSAWRSAFLWHFMNKRKMIFHFLWGGEGVGEKTMMRNKRARTLQR